MDSKVSIEQMWNDFLKSFPENKGATYDSWFFGDSAEMALELAELVIEGKKTAACGALWEFEDDGEPIPEEGGYSIVTDFQGNALCIIRTTKVSIQKFKEVDADFARKEGEGDLSYKYWRKGHLDFFIRNGSGELYDDLDEMPLVCEEFELVYPK